MTYQHIHRKRHPFQLMFIQKYIHFTKIHVDIWSPNVEIADQDQFQKITGNDLDHKKDQDQLDDLDIWDEDQWSFYNFPHAVINRLTYFIEVAEFKLSIKGVMVAITQSAILYGCTLHLEVPNLLLFSEILYSHSYAMFSLLFLQCFVIYYVFQH